MTDKIAEKSAVVIYSIISEIRDLEEELGDSIVENYMNNTATEFETFSDEKIAIFRKHGKKLIKYGDSVFLPNSISSYIKHPALNPLESIALIFSECEQWLKENNYQL